MSAVSPSNLNWLDRVRFIAGKMELVALEKWGQSITVSLPGSEYERFMLSNSSGAFTEWKTVDCETGKAVMFSAHGETAMASHKHNTTEVLIVHSGELVVRIGGIPHTLEAGDTITIQPGEEHSSNYRTAGKCLCIWPELKKDALEIDVLA